MNKYTQKLWDDYFDTDMDSNGDQYERILHGDFHQAITQAVEDTAKACAEAWLDHHMREHKESREWVRSSHQRHHDAIRYARPEGFKE